MIRRIFEGPAHQILVTVAGDEVTVAVRANTWDTWSPPLTCTDTQDDPPEASDRAGRYANPAAPLDSAG